MKIIADRNIPFIEGRVKGAELIMLPAAEIDKKAVRDADALIVRTRTRCDASLLKDSKVKVIATATIGTDHIDIPWCTQHGITVRNAPGCNAPGVALYVWASLLRHGFEPRESTLGVIGCGNVGGIVAHWGERLGARILVCDPPRKELGLKDHEYLPLEELMTQSDAVTVHTPLTMEGSYPTFHMINEVTLGSLRQGAVFVNAARGEVAATGSLCMAIAEGKIRHAIIDTWENEPNIDPHLLSLADVATCHIAGYSV
ncbi:MAG: 4-phosphoerythronate dehydrogenase, partial [Muribaculaceae bacterium]|nr:4-phosphoerythronate dehydrogenase [Muribaculaceae bacterium]